MSRVKRAVLGVRRCGPDYHWFYLRVEGMPTLEVGDEKVTWQIDDAAECVVAYVKREYYQFDEDKPRRLRVKKVTIVGPKQKIENLLYNLGDGIPGRAVGPHWKRDKEEDG